VSLSAQKRYESFVKRGKACSRNAPYVALPFDSRFIEQIQNS
jgi:hypothetical protein